MSKTGEISEPIEASAVWRHASPRLTTFGRAYPYLLSMVCVTLATLLTVGVEPLREKTSLTMYFVAVIIASYVGGLWPAMFTVVLSALAWARFVIPPHYSFLLESPGDGLRLVLFILTAVLTSSLYEQLTRAQRDVRRHQNRLQLALEAGRMGVWDYDLLRNEFWMSPELRQILRIEAEDFVPTYGSFLAFVHPSDRASVVQAMTSSRESRIDYQFEHRVVLRDNSIRWIATRGRTFVDYEGRAERMIGLVVDVTERHVEDSGSEMSTVSVPPPNDPAPKPTRATA